LLIGKISPPPLREVVTMTASWTKNGRYVLLSNGLVYDFRHDQLVSFVETTLCKDDFISTHPSFCDTFCTKASILIESVPTFRDPVFIHEVTMKCLNGLVTQDRKLNKVMGWKMRLKTAEMF